jgi:type IV pilus assembly protein PilW
LTFAPVMITQTAGLPDTITTLTGSGSLAPVPAQLTQGQTPNPSAPYRVNNRYGFTPGDLVIAAQPGQPCTLSQVSNLPPSPNDDQVSHDSGTYGTPPLPTRYNPAGGLCPPFPPASCVSYGPPAVLFDIGATPSSNAYSISNGQLMLQQKLAVPNTAAQAIFDGIVQLRAQYGKDTNNDGIVDTFDNVTPTTAAGWVQVLAIRLALVARSNQYEKTQVSPATINLLPALNPPPSTAIPTAPAADWNLLSADRNYRYKVFQTVVPIRNMIWRPS